MEWSGQQQVQFLLQSIYLGTLQGLLLDFMTGFGSVSGRKRWRWSDVLFGPLAALITFFGALIIMDGQLHPLLLFGVFLGMLLEHLTVGGMIRFSVRYVRGMLGDGVRFLLRLVRQTAAIIRSYVGQVLQRGKKMSKKEQKS